MNSFLRLLILSTLVTPALITMSCSHLANRTAALSSQEESLLLNFQKARSLEVSDSPASCALYSQMAQENFPLKTLSLLKAHIICQDSKNLAPVSLEINNEEPWLAELDSERQVVEALRISDLKALTEAYYKKAQKSDQLREKLSWFEKALEVSKGIRTPSDEDLKLQKTIQERIYKLAPRKIQNPKPDEYFAVAMDLIYQRKFAQGRRFLNKIKTGRQFSAEEQYQARRAYRNSFKIEQKKAQHVVEAGRFAKWTEKKSSSSRIHDAYVLWARAQWTEGNAGAAQRTLIKAEKILRKKKYPMDEIYWLRAKMAEEAKDLDEAIRFLAMAEKESRSSDGTRNRILFTQAWLLRKKLQYKEAAEAFLKLKNETEDPYDKNRYSFWLAKSLKQADQPEEAIKEFQELTTNDPLGYYGLVAYRELAADIPALEIERSLASEEKRPRGVPAKDYDLIRALIFVDEPEILGRFLETRAQELRSQHSEDSDAWLFYLKAYARAGLFNPLFAQVGSLETELKNKLLLQNPELLFPRAYLDLIQVQAEKFGVRPELMLSIIRQESAFNPRARSRADALGLMQVLPSVARAHQKKTGISFDHFEDLYKPELNIPVGASLLADLGQKYRGQFVLTVAAYNANEKAIASWLKTRLQNDPLEFIEDIPYEETKTYVKLVLRNFIFYSRLAEPSKTLAFPNWCLDDLQSFKLSTR